MDNNLKISSRKKIWSVGFDFNKKGYLSIWLFLNKNLTEKLVIDFDLVKIKSESLDAHDLLEMITEKLDYNIKDFDLNTNLKNQVVQNILSEFHKYFNQLEKKVGDIIFYNYSEDASNTLTNIIPTMGVIIEIKNYDALICFAKIRDIELFLESKGHHPIQMQQMWIKFLDNIKYQSEVNVNKDLIIKAKNEKKQSNIFVNFLANLDI